MRPIRTEEQELIAHLLRLAVKDHLVADIPSEVSSYNPKQLESIALSQSEDHEYGGDILRVEYIDTDDILVTITLTQDINGKLLDLDFWKRDFLPLISYPKTDKLQIVR